MHMVIVTFSIISLIIVLKCQFKQLIEKVINLSFLMITITKFLSSLYTTCKENKLYKRDSQNNIIILHSIHV